MSAYPLDITCPTCGALPRQECPVKSRHHKARREAVWGAEEAPKKLEAYLEGELVGTRTTHRPYQAAVIGIHDDGRKEVLSWHSRHALAVQAADRAYGWGEGWVYVITIDIREA